MQDSGINDWDDNRLLMHKNKQIFFFCTGPLQDKKTYSKALLPLCPNCKLQSNSDFVSSVLHKYTRKCRLKCIIFSDVVLNDRVVPQCKKHEQRLNSVNNFEIKQNKCVFQAFQKRFQSKVALWTGSLFYSNS